MSPSVREVDESLKLFIEDDHLKKRFMFRLRFEFQSRFGLYFFRLANIFASLYLCLDCGFGLYPAVAE